ncbi:hypothetical protein [Kamptonema formosum]|uniref:hypothetical protein n=1 Tax=Kamptonema formosum TaxID=331992 RepID=UPI00350FE002
MAVSTPAKISALSPLALLDAAAYPDDAPDKLKEMAQELGNTFPLCYDESQETAKAYTTACTLDFFVFDANRHLVCRGPLDDSRPSNHQPVTGKDLRAAIEAVLADRPVSPDRKPSIGCNIKWKPGNEPGSIPVVQIGPNECDNDFSRG